MRYYEIQEKSQAERKAEVGVEADQFFTRPEVAERFANWVKQHDFIQSASRIIEPATGSKDLAKHFDNIEMLDLFPQSPDITAQDFLTSNMGYKEGTVVIMNPPYGNSSDLAIKFFNKAGDIADHIAMIVPRTFRRPIIQNQLGRDFHLVDEYILPKHSFYLPAEGKIKPFNVPAVAQIWSRQDSQRELQNPPSTSKLFQLIPASQSQHADFAIRSRGGRAGQIVDVTPELTPKSFIFVKGDQRVRAAFDAVDWSQLGNDVLAARNISKADIVKAVEPHLKDR